MFEKYIYPNKQNADVIVSGENNKELVSNQAKKIMNIQKSLQIM